MSRHRVLRTTLAFLASTLLCGAAQAQLFRAYLASDGLDSNPCTLAAPCRLLPAALAAVTNGGEIWMLDSANYNAATVTITKSVTILAVPGAVGSVLAVAGNAIEVATPGTHVALRNLRIVPLPGGGGVDGIHVDGAAKLTVEDSAISGHSGRGITVLTQTAVRIINSIVRDNGDRGISLHGGAAAEISGSKFLTNGGSGVFVAGIAAPLTTSATVSDSVVSGNTNGVEISSSVGGQSARAIVTRSTVSDNSASGIRTFATGGATALATVGGNLISGSPTGLFRVGAGDGGIESLGNNMIRQNESPTTGAITTVPLM